jgi:hypothetical protein
VAHTELERSEKRWENDGVDVEAERRRRGEDAAQLYDEELVDALNRLRHHVARQVIAQLRRAVSCSLASVAPDFTLAATAGGIAMAACFVAPCLHCTVKKSQRISSVNCELN